MKCGEPAGHIHAPRYRLSDKLTEPVEPSEPSESRVSLVSQFEGPEYSAVRCLLFAANLTDVKYRLTFSDTPESLQT